MLKNINLVWKMTFLLKISKNTFHGLSNNFFGTVVRRLNQIIYFIFHIASHIKYISILSIAYKKNIIKNDKFVKYKYLGVYLIQLLKTSDRRDVLIFHYDFLCKKFLNHNKNIFLKNGLIIWQKKCDESDDNYFIFLEPSKLAPMEGELSVRFDFNSQTLFTLTFSIINGGHVSLPYNELLFVGGMQGGLNCREEIRHAAKMNGEISPSAILIIAIKAIAEALGINNIVGISSENQAAIGYAKEKILLNYDDLWVTSGGTKLDNGFFMLEPKNEKILIEVSSKHRARTRRKRLLKKKIQNDINLNFANIFL